MGIGNNILFEGKEYEEVTLDDIQEGEKFHWWYLHYPVAGEMQHHWWITELDENGNMPPPSVNSKRKMGLFVKIGDKSAHLLRKTAHDYVKDVAWHKLGPKLSVYKIHGQEIKPKLKRKWDF